MAAFKNKTNGTWYVQFRYTDWKGERQQKLKRGFATQKEAQAWEREFLMQKQADVNMTFESFAQLYEKDMKPKLKLNTWLTKESIIQKKILPYFGKRKLSEITAKDVMDWQNAIRGLTDAKGKPYSPTYLKTVHNQLSALFNHAVRYYGLQVNPAAKAGNMGVEERREMLFWTKEEYLKFADAMMDKPLSYYAFEMLYWCGIREGERTKRCKDKSLVGKVKETVMQVSMSKKWASRPAVDEATGEPLRTAKGKPVLRKSYSVLQDDFFQQMRSAGYTDLERGERGSSEEHLTVTQFKVKCEQERLAQLQEAAVLAQAEVDRRNREATAAEKKAAQAKAKLNDVAPMLKGMEKLAEEFSSDPEQVLPEAGPLESARAYREKKAKPLWAKIVKVLRSVYRAYYDLKSKFERLQADYGREVSKNSTLSERIYEVCAERDSLKGKVRDYERVRRAIGLEQADRILEAAYQQEHAEMERKRAAKSKIRIDAR